jgi:hypothetical protein
MGKAFFKCFNCNKIYDGKTGDGEFPYSDKLTILMKELNKPELKLLKNQFLFKYQLIDFLLKPCCSNPIRGWTYIHDIDLPKRTRKLDRYLDNNKIKELRTMMVAYEI